MIESRAGLQKPAGQHSGGGMVTSPHPLASEAGARILREGGNALDAAIAVGAAISVIYPHFCGLGGDAIWLVADEEGRKRCFLAIGQSAGTLPDFSGSIPVRGPLSVLTSACVVDSWRHAHEFSKANWGGKHSFASLLEDAIAHAENGFPVSRSQEFWLDFRKTEAAAWSGFAALFLPDGRAPPAGSIFRQPNLARSLKMIARDGPRSFYEGELAQRIATALQAAGSPLDAADLKDTWTRETEPLSLVYRGIELLAPPPPTQGMSTLSIMGILSHFDIGSLTPASADHVHLCVEAVKRAFMDRMYIGDPDFSTQAPETWLNPAHLARHARDIDMTAALAWPQPFKTGDTVFFGVTDQAGRSVSVLQSTYFDWGSGVVAGDTGILWQNRGAAFSLEPGHPNELKPKKRPFYTLNPGLGLREGKPAFIYGTQGADGQPQTLSVLLSRLIDFGEDAATALAGPRFLLGRTFSDATDNLKLEKNAGEAVFADLAARGHLLSPIDSLSPLAGQAGVIIRHKDGTLDAAHDPRGDGNAVHVPPV
jgi:oxamate amidohydrolase